MGDLDLVEVDALLGEDLDLARRGVRGGARVGHDRHAGAKARAGDGAVDLLDVLGDAGLVGGALEERGLDVGPLDSLLDVVDEEVGDLVGVAGDERGREVLVRVDAGAGDDLDARSSPRRASSARTSRPRYMHEGSTTVFTPRSTAAAMNSAATSSASSEVTRFDRVLAHGPHLRELDEDRLVARHQVLVDERFAELGSVDRTRDRLDLRPFGRILSKQLDRGDHHRREEAGDEDGHRDDPAARHGV